MDHQSPENDGASPQKEGISATDVIRRMKEIAGLKADMHLATELGTTRANVAKWKARNSIPFHEAVTIALRYGGSLDYILLGKDPLPEPVDVKLFLLESRAIRSVLEMYVDRGVISHERDSSLSLRSEVQLMANALTVQHTKLLRAASELEKAAGMTRQEALRHALTDLGIKVPPPEGPQ